MDTLQPRRTILPPSISNPFRHLFLAESDPALLYWSLGAITLIGLILRLWKINEPVAYDEAYTFIYFAAKPFKQILSDYSAPNNHILHTILVSLSYKLLGGHTWILRLPAFLAGTACIPAAYLAARRLFNAQQSLAGAALVALTPWFVSYSTNGRGYTLLTLFALLLVNFAGILVQRQSRSALIAYAITAALGFYTIPIFLYPMAGISLWVLATYLSADAPWNTRSRRVWRFLATCAAAGLLTFLLYSPVIFFGTGIRSIINNQIVEARDWNIFLGNLKTRVTKTWEDWMLNIAPVLQYILLVGFLVSVAFYRKTSNQRLPLQLFMVLALIILLALQRVAPMPRVWLFLEIFYMLFAGAGLVWLVGVFMARMASAGAAEKLIPASIVLITLAAFLNTYVDTQQASMRANRNILPEQQAAEYLASHLKPQDTIFSVAPVDIRTAYYLYVLDIPYDVFYQRDHPVPVQNAVVVLRTTTQYNTPQKVLDFFKLTPSFDLPHAELVFEYGPVNVFTVPSKSIVPQ